MPVAPSRIDFNNTLQVVQRDADSDPKLAGELYILPPFVESPRDSLMRKSGECKNHQPCRSRHRVLQESFPDQFQNSQNRPWIVRRFTFDRRAIDSRSRLPLSSPSFQYLSAKIGGELSFSQGYHEFSRLAGLPLAGNRNYEIGLLSGSQSSKLLGQGMDLTCEEAWFCFVSSRVLRVHAAANLEVKCNYARPF